MENDTLPVLVLTYLITKTGERVTLESERRINHADHADRVWLGKHCFWAMRNGREVSTRPV